MKLAIIAILLTYILSGCAPKTPPSCVAHVVQKKDVLVEEKDITCTCNCPATNQNVIETGGIIGGLLSLFNKDE